MFTWWLRYRLFWEYAPAEESTASSPASTEKQTKKQSSVNRYNDTWQKLRYVQYGTYVMRKNSFRKIPAEVGYRSNGLC